MWNGPMHIFNDRTQVSLNALVQDYLKFELSVLFNESRGNYLYLTIFIHSQEQTTHNTQTSH